LLVAIDQPGAVSTVKFEIAFKVPPVAPVEGLLILRPQNLANPPLKLGIHGSAPFTVELAPATKWEVAADIPGYWIRREVLNVAPLGRETLQKIVLWPKGRISGLIKSAEKDNKKSPLPSEITVTTLAPRKPGLTSDSPKGAISCPVEKTGSWSCELPAATYDLSFSAEGFSPNYRWAAMVPAGKTLNLGILELSRGASVTGWVEVEGALDPETCIARLSLLEAPGSSARGEARLEAATLERKVQKNGFFQITGVAAGSYRLEVRQPSYTTAKISPLQIPKGSETTIRQALVLKRPIQLELTVVPPMDWLGRVWDVQVSRVSEFSGKSEPPAFSGSTDREGRLVIPGQGAGRFSVVVADSLGNRLYNVIDLKIEGPEEARQTIEIPLLTIRGTVSLGKEPLSAVLWFGGTYGALAVKMESDRDGRFHGVLPKGGQWKVDISATDPKLQSQTEVRIEEDRQGRAIVDIALPDTHVFGKVLKEEGQAAVGAQVAVSSQDKEFVAITDEKGAFNLRGLPPGLLQISAQYSSAGLRSTANPIIANLIEDQLVGPIELHLRRTKLLAGRVLSGQGPVVGALVEVSPRPQLAFTDSARTDLDGGFTVQIPVTAESMAAVVSAPGKPLKAFEVPASDVPPTLNLEEEGGTLELLLSRSQAKSAVVELSVYQNGISLPLPTLWRWARGHGLGLADLSGEVIKIPNLAPGNYRACAVAQAVPSKQASAEGFLGQTFCQADVLENGATLRLKLFPK